MNSKQSSDHKQGDSKAGTQAGGLTPRNSSASKGVRQHNPSGENADQGNRNKRS